MKVFAVVGCAILTALLMISIYADIHKQKQNNNLKADKEYWQRVMCASPRYAHLEKCLQLKEGVTDG